MRHKSKDLKPFFLAMIVQVLIGSLYGWNIISSSLMDQFDFTGAAMGAVFGVALISFTGTMIPLGIKIHNFSPAQLTVYTALLSGLGFLLSGFSRGSLPLIFIGSGVLVGMGTGVGYISTLAYGLTPFTNKSLPTGLITASFAAGSIISSTLLGKLLPHYSITTLLQGFGGLQLLMLFIIASQLSRVKFTQRKIKSNESIPNSTMIPLWFVMFAATFGGLLIISNLKQIVGSLTNELNLALAISLFSIMNGLGRTIFGALPIVKHGKVIVINMLILGGTLGVMIFFRNAILLYIVVALIGMLFGSFFVLFPLFTMDQFGINQFEKLYPRIFLAYGVAAAVSATLGGKLYDLFPSPSVTLSIATLIEVFGAVLFIILLKRAKRVVDTNPEMCKI